MSGETIGTVQAEFVADTQKFDASVRGAEERMKQAGSAAEQMGDKIATAGEKTDRAAKLQEQAAERARRAWQREMQQQEQAAEREQVMVRARELASLRADILARSEEGVTRAMHGAVPATAAASGAMRALEGNFSHNIRAAERFMSTTLGLGPLLEKAFPVIGAIALGGALVEVGEKIKALLDKAKEAPRNIEMGFRSMEYSAASANAELQKSNDELQRQIDKLEHRPENNLAKALDDARIEAIRLGQSLDDALGRAKSLLKENEVSGFAALVRNQRQIPDEMKDEYLGKLSRLSDLGYEKSSAVSHGDLGKAKEVQANIDNLRRDIVAQADKQIVEASQPTIDANKAFGPDAAIGATFGVIPDKIASAKMMGDPSAVLAFLRGIRNQEQLELTSESLDGKHQDLTGRLDTLNAGKESTGAAKRAEEEAAKAQQRELVRLENHLKEMQAEFNLGAGMTQKYWEVVLASHQWGEAATERILARVDESTQKINDSITSRIRAMEKLQTDLGEAPQFHDLMPSDSDTLSMTKMHVEHMKNDAQYASSMAQFSFDDPHTQAVEQATRHMKLYKAEVQELGEELSRLQDEDAFNSIFGADPQRATKEEGLKNQIDALANSARIQAAQDQLKELDTSWHGMIGSVFDEIARKAQDTVSELHAVSMQFVSGSNNQIVNGMMGKKMNWSGVFGQAAHSSGTAGLEKLEGTAAKMLGFGGGKRDGQATDRSLYVTITNAATTAKLGNVGQVFGPKSFGGVGETVGKDSAGGAAESIDSGSLFGEESFGVAGESTRKSANPYESAATKAVSSTGVRSLMGVLNDNNWLGTHFGGLFGSGGRFGGYRANGGEVFADTPYIVGERGPELMIPGASGSIIPNHQLSSLGGSTSYTIDARGTDAAMVHQAVYRGMAMAHAQAVHDSAKSLHDQARRTPR